MTSSHLQHFNNDNILRHPIMPTARRSDRTSVAYVLRTELLCGCCMLGGHELLRSLRSRCGRFMQAVRCPLRRHQAPACDLIQMNALRTAHGGCVGGVKHDCPARARHASCPRANTPSNHPLSSRRGRATRARALEKVFRFECSAACCSRRWRASSVCYMQAGHFAVRQSRTLRALACVVGMCVWRDAMSLLDCAAANWAAWAPTRRRSPDWAET